MTILQTIVKYKLNEIAQLKKARPLSELKKSVRRSLKVEKRFLAALKESHGTAIIAEVKKRSPSKGVLRRDFRPASIARAFEKGGAAALSVLTDEHFFGGSGEILSAIRRAVRIPILRKDFILDEYQVWESKALGADAILLIAALLPRKKLSALYRLARRLDLDVLCEVHTKGEIKKVLPLKPDLIGINNRNLNSFKVDLRTTEQLAKFIPKKTLLVSESGIKNHTDVERLRKVGVKAVLVGEWLMRQKNLSQALFTLRGSARG